MILLFLLLTLLSTEKDVISGYASGYAPFVFEDVIKHRNNMNWWRNPLPRNWYTVAGYIATNDCSQVGMIVEIKPTSSKQWLPVLVGDCAGNDGTPLWMLQNNIVAELSYPLWQKWTSQYGTPLAVEIRQ